MSQSTEEKNQKFVLDACETLFNKRDYAKALDMWASHYIQHSAHIPQGREGLFGLIEASPASLKYENQLTLVNGDFVMLFGRFSGLGDGVPNRVVVDVVRIENGRLAEHWDVVEDEATRVESKSGLPMFGDTFPG